MPQFFILQHRTLLCFPLQHVSLYDILQLILLYFSETVFLAILFYDFNYSVEDIYFTEAYVMNLVQTSFSEEVPVQSTRKQVFDFIINELKEVMPNLPTEVNKSTYGRPVSYTHLNLQDYHKNTSRAQTSRRSHLLQVL